MFGQIAARLPEKSGVRPMAYGIALHEHVQGRLRLCRDTSPGQKLHGNRAAENGPLR